MNRKFKSGIFYILIIFALTGIDRLTKAIVAEKCLPGTAYPFFFNQMQIRLIHNSGSAFGYFKGNALIFSFLSAAVIIIFCAILFSKKKKHASLSVACVLIIAGATGNLIDRLSLNYVIDFIEPLFAYLPIFNIADVFVTAGIAIILVREICSLIDALKSE